MPRPAVTHVERSIRQVLAQQLSTILNSATYPDESTRIEPRAAAYIGKVGVPDHILNNPAR